MAAILLYLDRSTISSVIPCGNMSTLMCLNDNHFRSTGWPLGLRAWRPAAARCSAATAITGVYVDIGGSKNCVLKLKC